MPYVAVHLSKAGSLYGYNKQLKNCQTRCILVHPKLEATFLLPCLILILILNNTKYNNNNSKLLNLIFFYHCECIKCIELCIGVIFIEYGFNTLERKQKINETKIIGAILVIFILIFPIRFWLFCWCFINLSE